MNRFCAGLLLAAWLAAAVFVRAEPTYRLPTGVVELRALARQVAQITGRVVVYGADFTGQVEIEPAGPMTRQQVWNFFLSVLAAHGWGISESGGVARVVKRSTLPTQPGPVFSPPEGTPLPAEQLVTYTVELQNSSATEVAAQLATLIGPDGRLVPVPQRNSLILVDTQANVDRLRALIARLDAAGPTDTIQVVRLKKADAQYLSDLLRRIFAELVVEHGQVRRRGGAAPRLVIVAEPSTNAIVLRGEAREVGGAATLAGKIDTLPDPRVFIVNLQQADPEQMRAAIGSLMH